MFNSTVKGLYQSTLFISFHTFLLAQFPPLNKKRQVICRLQDTPDHDKMSNEMQLPSGPAPTQFHGTLRRIYTEYWQIFNLMKTWWWWIDWGSQSCQKEGLLLVSLWLMRFSCQTGFRKSRFPSLFPPLDSPTSFPRMGQRKNNFSKLAFLNTVFPRPNKI